MRALACGAVSLALFLSASAAFATGGAATAQHLAAAEPVAAKAGGITPQADTVSPASDDSSPADAPENALFDGIHASDADLEMIVYSAYTAAYAEAKRHQNLFSSDDLDFAGLRRAVRDALDKTGYGAANVETDAVASATAAKACATDGTIDLRFAFNSAGAGIAVAAVSDKRMSAYDYDPTKSSDLAITHAADCLPPGTGAAPDAGNDTAPDRLATPPH
jgi:hypothetical protein